MLATDAVYDTVPAGPVKPDVEPKTGALLCWPVEWIGADKPAIEGLHVTLGYWPEVQNTKEDILEALRSSSWVPYLRYWRVVDVSGIDVFEGSHGDIPVLRVIDQMNTTVDLKKCYEIAKIAFYRLQPFNTKYDFSPHVSVDLRTIVNPPAEFILRPLELWYKDDEPVPV